MPFRFSFDVDPLTGKQFLYVGDVGQNDIEEVDRLDLVLDAGANLGGTSRRGASPSTRTGSAPAS